MTNWKKINYWKWKIPKGKWIEWRKGQVRRRRSSKSKRQAEKKANKKNILQVSCSRWAIFFFLYFFRPPNHLESSNRIWEWNDESERESIKIEKSSSQRKYHFIKYIQKKKKTKSFEYKICKSWERKKKCFFHLSFHFKLFYFVAVFADNSIAWKFHHVLIRSSHLRKYVSQTRLMQRHDKWKKK